MNCSALPAQSERQAQAIAMGRFGMPSGISDGQQRVHLKKYLATQYPDMSDADIQAALDTHLGGGYASY